MNKRLFAKKTARCSVFALLVFGLSLAGGCATIIAKGVLAAFPTYAETEGKMPVLTPDQSRVVVYFPPSAPIAMAGFLVTVDRVHKTTVGNGTFVFCDLPAGQHQMSVKFGVLRGEHPLSVDTQKGKTTYVKLGATWIFLATFAKDPIVVSRDTAISDLADCRHNYKLPEPFNRRNPDNRAAF